MAGTPVGPLSAASERAESEVPELQRMASEAPSVAESQSSRAPAPQTLVRPSAQSSGTDFFDPDGFDSFFGLLEPQDTIVVRSYKGEDEDQILEELRPRFIVMYDPDPAFIRRIEVRRPRCPQLSPPHTDLTFRSRSTGARTRASPSESTSCATSNRSRSRNIWPACARRSRRLSGSSARRACVPALLLSNPRWPGTI
jgi:hypothetical protein